MSVFSVHPDKCKRDGLCAGECPSQIIELTDKDEVPKLVPGGEEFCIDCGHCMAVCPHEALFLHSMDPKACETVRDDLIPSFDAIAHFMKSRRSIRTYRDKPVDREIIEDLLDVARYAPTAHNYQPVHWLVIHDPAEVRKLAGIIIDWMRSMIEKDHQLAHDMHFDRVIAVWESGVDRVLRAAPHLIVAHADAQMRMAESSCTIALTYLELAAYARRLGACWAGYFTVTANMYAPMKEALALPEGHRTFGGMMLGYPVYEYQRIPERNKLKAEWR